MRGCWTSAAALLLAAGCTHAEHESSAAAHAEAGAEAPPGLAADDAPLGGVGTALLDGVLSPGEWDGAGRIDFAAALPQADGGGVTPATLLVMSDGTDLFFALRIERPSFGGATNPSFEFDEDADGLREDGDDAFGMSIGLFSPVDVVDAFRWTCPGAEPGSAGCGVRDDAQLPGFPPPGANDGAAAATNDGAVTVIELSHPLSSGDGVHDLALHVGDVTAFQLGLRLFALDPSCNEAPECMADTSVPPSAFRRLTIGAAAPPEPVTVEVDLKPGSFPNSVNLSSKGIVPLAILSGVVDATRIDVASVRVAGAPVAVRPNGTRMASLEDVDGDGALDLVVHVSTRSILLEPDATLVVVTGSTTEGAPFEGTDSIRIVH